MPFAPVNTALTTYQHALAFVTAFWSQAAAFARSAGNLTGTNLAQAKQLLADANQLNCDLTALYTVIFGQPATLPPNENSVTPIASTAARAQTLAVHFAHNTMYNVPVSPNPLANSGVTSQKFQPNVWVTTPYPHWQASGSPETGFFANGNIGMTTLDSVRINLMLLAADPDAGNFAPQINAILARVIDVQTRGIALLS